MPISPTRVFLQIWTGFRTCTKEEKSTKSTCNHRSFIQNAARLKITSRRLFRQWLPRRLRLQILKQIVGYLVWLASLLWKQMQLPRLGKILEQTRTWRWLHNHWVPRPLTQGHTMTMGIRDADLILFKNLKTNMHEVPSYYNCHVNNTTLGPQIGSITFGQSKTARNPVFLRLPCAQYHIGIAKWINTLGKGPTYQPTINPSQFIARQVPCRPDSYSKQEPNVRTL